MKALIVNHSPAMAGLLREALEPFEDIDEIVTVPDDDEAPKRIRRDDYQVCFISRQMNHVSALQAVELAKIVRDSNLTAPIIFFRLGDDRYCRQAAIKMSNCAAIDQLNNDWQQHMRHALNRLIYGREAT